MGIKTASSDPVCFTPVLNGKTTGPAPLDKRKALIICASYSFMNYFYKTPLHIVFRRPHTMEANPTKYIAILKVVSCKAYYPTKNGGVESVSYLLDTLFLNDSRIAVICFNLSKTTFSPPDCLG